MMPKIIAFGAYDMSTPFPEKERRSDVHDAVFSCNAIPMMGSVCLYKATIVVDQLEVMEGHVR